MQRNLNEKDLNLLLCDLRCFVNQYQKVTAFACTQRCAALSLFSFDHVQKVWFFCGKCDVFEQIRFDTVYKRNSVKAHAYPTQLHNATQFCYFQK